MDQDSFSVLRNTECTGEPSASSANVVIGNAFTDNGAYGVRIGNAASALNIVGMNMLTTNGLGAGLDNFLVTLQRLTNYPQF